MTDRNTVIGMALAALMFIGFLFYSNFKMKKEMAAKKQVTAMADTISQVKSVAASQSTISSSSVSKDSSGTTQDTAALTESKFGAFSNAANGSEKLITLETEVFKIVMTNKGGNIKSLELKKFKTFDKKPLILINDRDYRFAFQFPVMDNKVISTDQLYFEGPAEGFNIKGDEARSISFKLPAADGQYIEQKYSFKGNSYMMGYDVNFVNLGKVIPANITAVNLKWEQLCRQLERDIDNERRYSSVYYQFKNGDVEHLNLAKNEDKDLQSVNWLSFKQQFFNSTLLFKNGFTGKISTNHDPKEKGYNKEYKAELFFPISNGNSSLSCQFYYGPNDYSALKKLDNGMESIIPLSSDFVLFKWMGIVNKWIIIPIFNLLKNITSNYGIIIFILALLVKIVLTPLTYNSYKYAAIMQVLKPEMDALKEKFKDDQQKLGTEQMKLYQKVGVNPLSGCFPVLLQMPILIAMYNFFPASIELRQSGFLWADDLSTYDAIISFPALFGAFNHISLFTVLMTITSLISAYFTPQMNTQDNPAMKYMPYFFPLFLFFVFNGFPAALTYYYLLFNVMSIIQQWSIKKFFIDEEKLHRELQERKTREPKKSGWMSKLEDMQKKAQEQQKQASPKKK